jgi:hypothetical protein
MTFYAQVLGAMGTGETVQRDDVRRWIDSGDLLTWSALFTLLDAAPKRVNPELPAQEQIDLARRYLLRCIEENPMPGEHLHGGFEAAWELAGVMRQWRHAGGRAAAAMRRTAGDLEKIYRRGDAAVKSRIACGVLEHAFEDPSIREVFAPWERDDELREAYKLATEWGAAHE